MIQSGDASTAFVVSPGELLAGTDAVIFDCRFELGDARAGRRHYDEGHIPGAHYLHLEHDLSAPAGVHGGRHPLPPPQTFARTLAQYGVTLDTPVIAYDDSRFAFAARLWWLMDSLGYRPPRLLDGGFSGFVQAGGVASSAQEAAASCDPPAVSGYRNVCDKDTLRDAQARGAWLVDAREPARYAGLEEPIDPVAGHIPGARNHPWQAVTSAAGCVLESDALRSAWGETLTAEALVVYCGSGVTACVDLWSLRLLGRRQDMLYAGSWSDWCSYLSNAD